MEERAIEQKRQAIEALNRTIGWCSQVGIAINLFMVVDSTLAVLTSDQMVVNKDRLELRESIKND